MSLPDVLTAHDEVQPAMPLDAFVVVSLIPGGREGRGPEGQFVAEHWKTIVAWESVGTLEDCRSFVAQWEMEPAIICRLRGTLERLEDQPKQPASSAGQKSLFEVTA